MMLYSPDEIHYLDMSVENAFTSFVVSCGVIPMPFKIISREEALKRTPRQRLESLNEEAFSLAGVVLILPVAITFVIIGFFINFLTRPFLITTENALDYYGVIGSRILTCSSIAASC